VDLIVVRSRGFSGINHALMRSEPTERGEPIGAVDVLATGVRGALNLGELAARPAAELTKSTGAELHVMHVKLLPITLPYPEVLDWRDDLERAEREAREILDRMYGTGR
jgi:nucleotide-binding universal stress UspA family protein